MKLDETVGVVDAIRDHARSTAATRRKLVVLEREDWTSQDEVWGPSSGPDLDVYVGPGVGFLVLVGRDGAFITTGGVNESPVDYAVDEWATRSFPARTELPIEHMVTAVRQFLSDGTAPTSVRWTPYRFGRSRPTINAHTALP